MRSGVQEIYKKYSLICNRKVKAVRGNLKVKLEKMSLGHDREDNLTYLTELMLKITATLCRCYLQSNPCTF